MKTNISTLMSIIAEEEKNLNNHIYAIEDNAISISVEELDGRVNIIDDNKQAFDYDLEEIEKSVERLSKLKATLYAKNNEFKLSDGRSIQQAIVDNNNLRRLKSMYERLVLLKNSKKRVTEVHNSYFECKSINFDLSEIKDKLAEIEQKIQKTDFEIAKLNSLEFTI